MTTRLGAAPEGPADTRFTVWAPVTSRVEVVLDDSGTRHTLEPGPGGYHRGVAPCGPGARYRLSLDGSRELADPASRAQPDGVHGPSQVVDLAAFEWHDAGFHAEPLRDAVLYELHVGTFTREGTLDAAVTELDDLVTLGVTHVELMPLAQFPGGRNWGYDGVFPFAVQNTYGGPAALQRFVDAAHERGLAVVLDVVYNHLGPEGNVLPDYGPYVTDRYRTPWGPAVNLDGPDSDAVRAYFVTNALSWLEDFHVDCLRLDAVHELVDRSARPFLCELARAVDDLGERTGRRHWLIAESSDNDPRVTSPEAAGGFGLDAQWNDDFHHAVHAALTAERKGYYQDFGCVDDVARAMDRGFVYQGEYSAFRRRRHGAPSSQLDPWRFVVYSQNHDQVGNRPDGARLTTLVSPEQAELAAALVALSPGVPLLFMGEEYGETAPFPYFVDHGDPELTEAVRRGRASEHASSEETVPDPADPATYTSAVLDRMLRSEGGGSVRRQLYASLLDLRRSEPAFRRAPREGTRAHSVGSVVTLTRTLGQTTVAALFNLGPAQASAPLPAGACWHELLTDSSEDGPSGAAVDLRPWGYRVFRSADGVARRAAP